MKKTLFAAFIIALFTLFTAIDASAHNNGNKRHRTEQKRVKKAYKMGYKEGVRAGYRMDRHAHRHHRVQHGRHHYRHRPVRRTVVVAPIPVPPRVIHCR